MRKITALPHETQRMILAHLEPHSRSLGKPDLVACALVCKLWHTLVLPILYRRFWFDIVAPPAPDDRLLRYLAAPRLETMRHLHILVTSGLHGYTTPSQCHEIHRYIRRIISAIDSTIDLSVCELDLIPFTPGDCLPHLWPQLRAANTLLLELVRSVIRKRPYLHFRLGRHEFLAEAQVQTIWRPLFDSMIIDARGAFGALSIGCPLGWMLDWLQLNPQLREVYYTKTAGQEHEINEFWEVLGRCQTERLMLDGFRFPSVHMIPGQLVELILTHLNNTVVATNEILTHLPNLRVLSLRLEAIPAGEEDRGAVQCARGDTIVSKGLRKAWWTKSSAPERTVSVVGEVCPFLQSVSPPQNVTDEDLVALSQSAKHLSEMWLIDCPNISEGGFRSLRNLKQLQLHIGLTRFLAEQTLREFLRDNKSLKGLAIVFDGRADEEMRRLEVAGQVAGERDYHARLFQAMTFQPYDVGDKFLFDVKKLRGLMD